MNANPIILIGAVLLFALAACSNAGEASVVERSGATLQAEPATRSLDSVPAAAPDGGVALVDEPQSEPVVTPQLEAMDILAATEEILTGIYQDALPSVVYVNVVRRLDPGGAPFSFDFFGGGAQAPGDEYQHGAGSGFVWDAEGHILTNYHVVEGSDSVSVVFADGEELDAEFLGGDPDSDLAVLKIDPAGRELRPMPRGSAEDLRVGQLALAIGSPFGQDFTLTSGIVSAVGRTIRSGSGPYSIPMVVQTDAPINPGNSGGPLLDRHGRVIGINTQIISRSGVNAGVGFAVPIDIAKRVAPDLITHGKYEYAWLGISGATLTADAVERMGLPDGSRGVLIVDATENGPAGEAGLKGGDDLQTIEGQEVVFGGDVIVAVDGEETREMHDLISYLVEHTRPGDEIALDILHQDGEEATITVTLGTRPEN